ncbi:beta-ketoacyl-ACP synthase II [uncultured Oscillibacter sp.]|uniref:beta-ketoacyl-ACP synthase II n=1 Tax=uncultured Oscillibacter sp. TaxID=876091 RepID=UPI00280BF0F7|nr:beta-ketoacyl-ACP synthase II [uncultured Oscillibacter sp.]
MDRRRVVITGLGAITPVGLTAPESWQAVKDGVCGVAPITQFDTEGMKVSLAAEVKGFVPEDHLGKPEAKRMGRFTQFAVVCAREAMADSGLVTEAEDLDRCGVIISSGIGGLSITEAEHDRGLARGWDRVSPFYIPTAISNMAAGQVAIDTGFRGMCTCPVTACAGGTNAVGDAFHYVRDGYADVMLCGGTEAAVTPLAIGGFTSMKALSQATDPARASIPFDAERTGFVLGEGAGVLVLEELEHALKRGAHIYAEIVGYGVTCDAYHMTAPRPDGSGGAKAMSMAIADAGIAAEEVDYINAHGTSTHLNDAGETAAVKTVFGDHARKLAMSSTKSMTGHMLGAAGAVEAIFTAMTLKDGYLPATIHYSVPDPECDLDVVPNVGRSADVRYALSNSLGFGGHNGSVLLKKWEA